jgi:hypothetical protein
MNTRKPNMETKLSGRKKKRKKEGRNKGKK